MKIYLLLAISIILSGCGSQPSPESDSVSKTEATKAVKSTSKLSKDQHTASNTASKTSGTGTKKQSKKKATHTKQAVTVKSSVKPKKISPKIAVAHTEKKATQEKNLLMQTPTKFLPDSHRHLFIIGNKLAPITQTFSQVLQIDKGQTQKYKTLNQLLKQETIKRDSNFITMLTLADFLESTPLSKTLREIENLPTKKSFFIIFYNYEKNIHELLETKLLNGLKNILLFVPLTNKTSLRNEPSITSLIQAIKADAITFEQLHQSLCKGNTQECTTFFRGNNYLLY